MILKKQKSIAILTCWYGNYPWYFPYFIHSCKFNPTIDFFIITNNKEPLSSKLMNVKVVHKSIDQIKTTAFKKLALKVNIGCPYKLYDLKPAYGFLFSELIKGYDFWGHGDIDVVYGNIRNFITDEILSNYHVISSRHDYTTGTFCLYKNDEQMNTLFKESKDFKKVFTTREHFCFDECNFLFEELQNGASVFDYPDNIQSMTYVVKKAEAEGKLKAFFDFIIIEGSTGKIKWERGKIIYKDTYEAMFYHLIKFKIDCKKPILLNPIPDTFYFSEKEIFVNKENTSWTEIYFEETIP